jgi:hypothetical protein
MLSSTAHKLGPNCFTVYESDNSFWRIVSGNSFWPYAQNFNLAVNVGQAVKNVRAGALVRMTATIAASWGTTTEGSYESFLYRDGENVWAPGQRLRFGQSSAEGQGHGAATMDMCFIETIAGAHTYEWRWALYGTSIAATVISPVLSVGP